MMHLDMTALLEIFVNFYAQKFVSNKWFFLRILQNLEIFTLRGIPIIGSADISARYRYWYLYSSI